MLSAAFLSSSSSSFFRSSIYFRAIFFISSSLNPNPSLKRRLKFFSFSHLLNVNIFLSAYDDRLVTLAKASVWLGNDETHYVKKHPDYTLNNMKAFINAFITFIDSDLAYEAAYKLVSPKDKS